MRFISSLFLLSFFAISFAKEVAVTMYLVKDGKPGVRIGSIIAQDTTHGLLIRPNLTDLPPGMYGFHVHMHPKCTNFFKDAGGHYDPKETMLHLGPYSLLGHLGDLPNLFVNASGIADMPMLAPRLKADDLLKKALVIHSTEDTYTQSYYTNIGTRLVCGVTPSKSKKTKIPKKSKSQKKLIKLQNTQQSE